jgi:hypothetical protein
MRSIAREDRCGAPVLDFGIIVLQMVEAYEALAEVRGAQLFSPGIFLQWQVPNHRPSDYLTAFRLKRGPGATTLELQAGIGLLQAPICQR